MLRHLANGSQWRAIDREFLKFTDDARNLSFALSTDGMNPFGGKATGIALGLLLYVYTTFLHGYA